MTVSWNDRFETCHLLEPIHMSCLDNYAGVFWCLPPSFMVSMEVGPKIGEEQLREAACYGDEESLYKLVERGINVNAQHEINGWSALHWAAKRGHTHIVSHLLSHGADKNALTKRGETAADLSESADVLKLLGVDHLKKYSQCELPITPSYLMYPPVNYKTDMECNHSNHRKAIDTNDVHNACGKAVYSANSRQAKCDELVLKLRVAHAADPDFIEVELPKDDLTYSRLIRVCCQELCIDANQIAKIRKLPDTMLRKDKDIQRLHDFQELEVVLKNQKGAPNDLLISPFFSSTNSPLFPVNSGRILY